MVKRIISTYNTETITIVKGSYGATEFSDKPVLWLPSASIHQVTESWIGRELQATNSLISNISTTSSKKSADLDKYDISLK